MNDGEGRGGKGEGKNKKGEERVERVSELKKKLQFFF